MALGAVMLAHERLDRAASFTRALTAAGIAVAVHIDSRVPAKETAAFAQTTGDAIVLSRHRADWGRIGLIDATLDGVATLLAARPELAHVALVSGSCLPTRPLDELIGHVSATPQTDFIESVSLAEDDWVQDGLSAERLSLFHPFSHRRHRWLFSASVELQRRLGVRRRLPTGLEPHLGTQWWCLSSATLRAILSDPRLPEWRRFFRYSWIPDESFFQTIIRTIRPNGPLAPPLHLYRFGRGGRPLVFHDDHRDLLLSSDRFFARKIDPDADALYETFLPTPPTHPRAPVPAHAFEIDDPGARQGVFGAGRMPVGTTANRAETAAPYVVVLTLPDFAACPIETELHGACDLAWFSEMFGNDPVRFPPPFGPNGPGNLPSAPLLRDWRPAQYLGRAVSALAPRTIAFRHSPDRDHAIARQLVADPNARLLAMDGDLVHRLRVRPGDASPQPLRAWIRHLDATDDVAAAIRLAVARVNGSGPLDIAGSADHDAATLLRDSRRNADGIESPRADYRRATGHPLLRRGIQSCLHWRPPPRGRVRMDYCPARCQSIGVSGGNDR